VASFTTQKRTENVRKNFCHGQDNSGHAVAQFVEALRYKSEGRGDFSFT